MPEAVLCDVDAKGKKLSHCPFGCTVEELDEYGYCYHLLGFTNDGKIVEPVAELSRKDKEGKLFKTGLRIVSWKGRQAIKDSDVLVNPEFDQLKDGYMYRVKKWVSSRVYRENMVKPASTADVFDDDGKLVNGTQKPEVKKEDGNEVLSSVLTALNKLNDRIEKLEDKKPKRRGKTKYSSRKSLQEELTADN